MYFLQVCNKWHFLEVLEVSDLLALQKPVVDLCAYSHLSTGELGTTLESSSPAMPKRSRPASEEPTPSWNDRIVGDPSHTLVCSVCHEVFDDPHMLPDCGHSFCLACITRFMRHKKRCPLCKKPSRKSAAKNIIVRNLIHELPVRCMHQMRRNHMTGEWVVDSEVGCKFTGTRDEVSAHEVKCGWAVAQCPLIDSQTGAQCKHRGRWVHLSEHMKECDLRPVPCPFEGCSANPSAKHLESHKLQCVHGWKRCPIEGCGMTFRTEKEVQEHIAVCPKKIIKCKYAGCGYYVRREDFACHNMENAHRHLCLERTARKRAEEALCGTAGGRNGESDENDDDPICLACSDDAPVAKLSQGTDWQSKATLILQATMNHPSAFAFIGEVEWESLELTDYPQARARFLTMRPLCLTMPHSGCPSPDGSRKSRREA